MPDILTPEQRHKNMAAIHSTSTKPEVRMRHELWRRGFRYRKNNKRLPGSPDIVLSKYRTAIFVHGCFWHGHKGCKKYTVPKSNTEFWIEKVARNQQRDQDVWRQLEAKDWSVIIVWECELEKKRFEETIERVVGEIIENGRLYERRRQERKLLREQRLIERSEQKERQEAMMLEIRGLNRQ
jgi:DNA mismatch endonuclease (patch repair protein)